MGLLEQIVHAQAEQGQTELQEAINDGSIWLMEGSAGRHAMDCLKAGICILPTVAHFDYYGNKIPPRCELQDGTKGTLLNAKNYYEL